ncbi:hypothetical protein lerEdw1_004272 [Lerista edwardsae]|nr:hypothetical protein lerEdw1_004272 [Lerista edwardsae]
MMRLRSPALLRDLLRLSQTGAMTAGGSGLFVCCRRPALRRLHLALPAVAGRPPPLRLLPGARSLCTRSEGILEEPGKGPPTAAEADAAAVRGGGGALLGLQQQQPQLEPR